MTTTLDPVHRAARLLAALGWPALALATHWPGLELPVGDDPVAILATDKLLHFGAFSLLTVITVYARPTRSGHFATNMMVVTALAAAYAVIDEVSQIWFDRTVAAADIAANLAGVLMVAVTLLAPAVVGGGRARLRHWPPIFPSPAPSTAARPDHGFVSHAMLVSGLTMASRVTGLARGSVMAAALGASPISNAFYLAFLVPNLFRRLFGEGALSTAFIPVYSRLVRKDTMEANRLATAVVVLTATVLSLGVVGGEVGLAAVLACDALSPDTALVVRLCMIMLPYMPLICLVALLGAICQVHGRHGVPAAVPIVLNVAWIAGALGGIATVAGGPHNTFNVIFSVAIAVLVAGVLQLLWQVLATLRVAHPVAPQAGTGDGVREVLRVMMPILLGVAVFQINVLLDGLLAFFLAPRQGVDPALHWFGYTLPRPVEVGAVAALQWAQRLYQFPLGVFGIAIATAIYPALAAAGRPETATSDGGHDDLAAILRRGLRLTVFIALPAGVGLLVLRVPVVRLIYQRGAFTPEDVQLVAGILAGYASAVWAYALILVITRAFYAAGNRTDPVRISVWMVLLNVTLNLVLVWWLHAAGLAWSTALCAVVGVVLLLYRLRRIVPTPVDRTVRAGWSRSALATTVMAGVLLVALALIGEEGSSTLRLAVEAVALVGLGTATYFITARCLGCEELSWLRHPRRTASLRPGPP